MNIIELISSVSKIAIGAFAITLAVVGYEVYLLMKKRRSKKTDDKEITLPEFKEDAQGSSFTPLDVSEAAAKPVALQSRKISKTFLPVLLGLLVLIVLFAGYLIFRRNQVSSLKVDVNEVSPVSQTDGAPEEGVPIEETHDGADTDSSGQGGFLITPTAIPEPSSSPIPTSVIIAEGTEQGVTITPTVTQDTINPTSDPIVTISAEISPTLTPISTELPIAGTYQTTLIIAIVAISVIYLAFIL